MRITSVTTTTCSRCGTDFDTNREPAARGADPSRCPSCGEENDAPRGDGGDVDETVRVPRGTDEVEVNVTLQFRED